MPANNQAPVTIRRATAADVGPILDLLTAYDLPRSYFEPWYLNDPTYRPEQSWVAEAQGRLLSHVRVYDRWLRVERMLLHIAGIGNVITAKAARGHGLSGRMLQAMLPVLARERYAYSLLWTHLPHLYQRYGWTAVQQQVLHGQFTPPTPPPVSIALSPLSERDLPAVMRLYDLSNAARTGAFMRSPEYWRGQISWLQETPERFLVAYRPGSAEPAGYVRRRDGHERVEILELGLAPGDFEVGRVLLAAAAQEQQGRFYGQFPPSLREDLLYPDEYELVAEPGLMGRVLDLDVLVQALEPLWLERLRASQIHEATLHLASSVGPAAIELRHERLLVRPEPPGAALQPLTEGEFAHLLFYGVNEDAAFALNRPDAALLQALFPRQDFVIWQSDAF